MDLGSRITELKKVKGWPQSQLAKNMEASSEIIGRYERNDAKPSIKVAKRLADVLDVSLDYLVGNAVQKIDKITLGRIKEINRLKDTDKNMVYAFFDVSLSQNLNYRVYYESIIRHRRQ